VPKFVEAPESVEMPSSVDATDPAEIPTPPDAEDSATSPNIATRASTTFFLLIFIMLILRFFNFVFEKIEATAGQWRLMEQTQQ
jgi:hypothetical protein